MKRLKKILLSLLLLSLTLGCQQQGGMQSGLDVDAPENPFTENFGSEFDNTILDGTDDNVGGSGGSGNLTNTDKTALQNLFAEFGTVNPQDEVDIPPELESQLKSLLAKERSGSGTDLTPIKMALASKVLSKCMGEVALYAPQPGEPLQGDWSGTCARGGTGKKNKGGYSTQLNFTVTGVFAKTFQRRGADTPSETQNPGYAGALGIGPARFSVAGNNGFTGVMQPNAAGAGQVRAGAWKAALFDKVPNAPASQVSRTAGDTNLHCSGNVAQKTFTNKIPEKFTEGTKKLNQCYRKALVLFSPVMDDLFKTMNPQIAQLLLTKMLGLSSK